MDTDRALQDILHGRVDPPGWVRAALSVMGMPWPADPGYRYLAGGPPTLGGTLHDNHPPAKGACSAPPRRGYGDFADCWRPMTDTDDDTIAGMDRHDWS